MRGYFWPPILLVLSLLLTVGPSVLGPRPPLVPGAGHLWQKGGNRPDGRNRRSFLALTYSKRIPHKHSADPSLQDARGDTDTPLAGDASHLSLEIGREQAAGNIDT